MYNITFWLDHAAVPARTFKITDNGDDTYTLVPVGKVVQQGTPMSAANFNNMEEGIHSANVAAIMAMNTARLAMETSGSNTVIKNAVILNSAVYPFNNSGDDVNGTIALTRGEERHNTDYAVFAEVISARHTSGDYASSKGLEGNIVISDKMVNGFKCRFTGSAQEVRLRLFIVGGM